MATDLLVKNEAKVLFCSRCGTATTQSCSFALRGKLSGNICGLPVCKNHRGSNKEIVLCLAHESFTFSVKKQEVEAVAAEESRPEMTLSAVKELAAVMLEADNRTNNLYVAGLVMLMPIIRSCEFTVESVSKISGYRENRISRYVKNLTDNGIWAEDGWCCEWCEFFTDPPEDKLGELQMSFILDAMVAVGSLSRSWDGENFLYKKLENFGKRW